MGELRIMAFNFAPKGWAQCNGQFLPINQNQALFSLLGTTYGGDGQTTFALPDLRSRTPIHVGQGFIQGQAMGTAAHTITMTEMPQHVHFFRANTADADKDNATAAPTGSLGKFSNGYRAPGALTTLSPTSVTNIGGSQPHENRQPYSVLNICICLQGIFPSRN
jgi:microcystin-dependent protein